MERKTLSCVVMMTNDLFKCKICTKDGLDHYYLWHSFAEKTFDCLVFTTSHLQKTNVSLTTLMVTDPFVIFLMSNRVMLFVDMSGDKKLNKIFQLCQLHTSLFFYEVLYVLQLCLFCVSNWCETYCYCNGRFVCKFSH